jgi:hypothetical protein
MPYIIPSRRPQLTPDLAPQNAGELNFCITSIVKDYLISQSIVNYTTLNEVIGVLECAKLELYRRLAAPYEDSKKAQNGDVY